MTEYNDYPIEDCLKTANELNAKGVDVYQKFTCEHCGNRLTMETPNTFYRSGTCDNCGQVTIITRCNYLVHAVVK